MAKPSIPQGTRDFTADTVRKRNYILTTIKNIFEIYGFEPLETPAMENLDTLMGKYGEEGDKLIFKILNNGISDPKNIEKSKEGFTKILEGKSSSDLTERALKYDLTIPFARHVAMNHGRLTFPYRRYQVQPVWRADRPQKGRYREFTQCDADVVGSTALINEVELCNIYNEVFNKLGLWDYELKINSRKILTALATLCGGASKLTDITVAIDKLNKIGLEKVKEELLQRGLSEKQIAIIEKYLLITGNNEEKLEQITALIGHIETGKKGIEEIAFVYKQAGNVHLQIDFTLARGLNYYTGIILEATAPPEVKMGSIGGGGRYDDLTGLFDVPGIAGVGISFGVDRIYDVLEELQLFPAEVHTGTKAIFFNMGETESLFAFTIMQQLRSKGISCELYHEFTKISKQFSYAEKKKIQYAVIIGSKEIEQKYCLVKHLSTGLQEVVIFDQLFSYFNK
ncbi:histidine--tRNA ligase [Ferruginibacter sp.]|uniref:histidine--tRNA ligase n=1 Tax=Ferruginibacter sp. TaxID=1940288 RepID=UPI0019B00D47|nr:histidine--tRNA ligase [Ferruginibacter sp.]MBC7626109.1 histidine--tRNA ligase [Ferruginibacter sp.]